MSVDREQIRRDARIPDDELARIRNWLGHWSSTISTETPEGVPLAKQLLAHGDALLDELEQAEARWQEMEHPFDRSEFDALSDRLEQAEQKLGLMREAWDGEQADFEGVLAKLEQAERELALTGHALANADRRLARVPALVEAGKRLRVGAGFTSVANRAWDDALAAFEAEQ